MKGSLVDWTWLRKNSEFEDMTVATSKIEKQREKRQKEKKRERKNTQNTISKPWGERCNVGVMV